MTVKEVLEALKLVPAEASGSFNASPPIRVIWQAVMLLMLLGLYFLALKILLGHFDTTFSELRNDTRLMFGDPFGSVIFYLGMLVPVLAILLIFGVPAALQWLRERIHSNDRIVVAPDAEERFFRVHPYEARNEPSFERKDGIDRDVCDWLKQKIVHCSICTVNQVRESHL